MGVILCPVTQAPAKMGDHILLDLEEWALVLSKMLRFHFNISEDIKKIVQTIRVEMKPELIPLAEEKSNFGKVVKKAIREMWALEYEVDELDQVCRVDRHDGLGQPRRRLHRGLDAQGQAPPVCAQLHPQQADYQAGGCEEVVCGPDQGPRGHEGDSPCQACGSREARRARCCPCPCPRSSKGLT